MRVRILGIDPGIAIVGFGLIEADRGRTQLLNYGAITTPAGLPLARRLVQIEQDMERAHRTVKARRHCRRRAVLFEQHHDGHRRGARPRHHSVHGGKERRAAL